MRSATMTTHHSQGTHTHISQHTNLTPTCLHARQRRQPGREGTKLPASQVLKEDFQRTTMSELRTYFNEGGKLHAAVYYP
jgi:hypothetical protein